MNFEEKAERIMASNFKREEPKMLREVLVEAMEHAYFEALRAVGGTVITLAPTMDRTALWKALAESIEEQKK